MKIYLLVMFLLLVGFQEAHSVDAQQNKAPLRVGPTRELRTPSEAARIAGNGDVVEIDPGLYENDAAVWGQSNLTIRGIAQPHISANGAHKEGKGVWVIKGDNVLVENVEISGARVPDGNGAAIRFEGRNITIRDSYFHNNQNGFLCGKNGQSDILFEHSEFSYNGSGDGRTHNIYVGNVNSFTMQFCYSHHAVAGHNVKSRARMNHIKYNRIMDEADGASSFAIDIPNGGTSFLIGNVIQQGPETENSNMVAYGAEGLENDTNELYVINNTFVNDRHYGVFLKIADISVARVINNIFYGNGDTLTGQATMLSNLVLPKKKTLFIEMGNPGFVDVTNYDYRLLKRSRAVNKGIIPGKVNGFDLTPEAHYIHPLKSQKRVKVKEIDIGAYEYMTLD